MTIRQFPEPPNWTVKTGLKSMDTWWRGKWKDNQLAAQLLWLTDLDTWWRRNKVDEQSIWQVITTAVGLDKWWRRKDSQLVEQRWLLSTYQATQGKTECSARDFGRDIPYFLFPFPVSHFFISRSWFYQYLFLQPLTPPLPLSFAPPFPLPLPPLLPPPLPWPLALPPIPFPLILPLTELPVFVAGPLLSRFSSLSANVQKVCKCILFAYVCFNFHSAFILRICHVRVKHTLPTCVSCAVSPCTCIPLWLSCAFVSYATKEYHM